MLFALTLAFGRAVLYRNAAFSILVLSTFSSYWKKDFLFSENMFQS